MNTGLYVVMGVAGAGKSVIGSALARALGIEFVDGDDYHSAENLARMSAGIPLTDEDRVGWLAQLAARLREANDAGNGLVIACSALKRTYRDVLRAGAESARFIYLRGPRGLLAERLANRIGHFMPGTLLDSQLAALEEPLPDEDAWVFDIHDDPSTIVATVVARAASSAGNLPEPR